jgi:alkyl hydroperoxide reductase subunit F
MLDTNLKTQLKAYLERLTRPVQLILTPDDSDKSCEMQTLLSEIAELSDKISIAEDADPALRRPSFAVTSPGHDIGIRFAGIPMGHEFTSLVLALLQAGGHPPKTDAGVIEQIRAIDQEMLFEVYISLSCQNCPEGAVAESDGGTESENPRCHDRRRTVPV